MPISSRRGIAESPRFADPHPGAVFPAAFKLIHALDSLTHQQTASHVNQDKQSDEFQDMCNRATIGPGTPHATQT